MLLTMLAMAMAGASASAADAPADKITLSPDARWALVTGLRYRLGGPFILANLDEGDAACGASGACIAAETLRVQSGSVGAVDSMADLMAHTAIGNERPVAIVALRSGKPGARRSGYVELELTMSVYDGTTQQWSLKDAVIGVGPPGADNMGRTRVLALRDSRHGI